MKHQLVAHRHLMIVPPPRRRRHGLLLACRQQRDQRPPQLAPPSSASWRCASFSSCRWGPSSLLAWLDPRSNESECWCLVLVGLAMAGAWRVRHEGQTARPTQFKLVLGYQVSGYQKGARQNSAWPDTSLSKLSPDHSQQPLQLPKSFKPSHCYLKAQIPRTNMSLARVAFSKAPLVAARMAAKRPIPSSSMAAISTPLSTSANMALDNLKGVLEGYRQVQ